MRQTLAIEILDESGPDPATISASILETYRDTDLVSLGDSPMFFSATFGTVVIPLIALEHDRLPGRPARHAR